MQRHWGKILEAEYGATNITKIDKNNIKKALINYYKSNNIIMYRNINLTYYFRSMKYFFNKFEVKYLFFLVTISIVILIEEDNFFYYVIYLFDVIKYFSTMKTLIFSITVNKINILISSVLACIILYIYSSIGYYYFNSNFFVFSIENGENTCTSIIQCFVFFLSLSPRSSGSIGDMLIRPSFKNYYWYFLRWILDFSIFICINLIFLTIIFGFIINTFGTLRNQKNIIEQDIKTKCSICSLDRYLFDKYASGFKYHIKNEHNIWYYYYYLYYLNEKDHTEYTGIESYINDMMEKQDFNWIPVLESKSIKTNNKSNTITILNNILELVKNLNNNFNNNI